MSAISKQPTIQLCVLKMEHAHVFLRSDNYVDFVHNVVVNMRIYSTYQNYRFFSFSIHIWYVVGVKGGT